MTLKEWEQLPWWRQLFTAMPNPRCEVCGREMKPGFRNARVIVDPMCAVPHPITHIPNVPAYSRPLIDHHSARNRGT